MDSSSSRQRPQGPSTTGASRRRSTSARPQAAEALSAAHASGRRVVHAQGEHDLAPVPAQEPLALGAGRQPDRDRALARDQRVRPAVGDWARPDPVEGRAAADAARAPGPGSVTRKRIRPPASTLTRDTVKRLLRAGLDAPPPGVAGVTGTTAGGATTV